MSDATAIPPPPRPREYEGVDRSTGTALLVVGALLVVLGLVLLANPFAAIWILGVLIGASLILGGLAEVAVGRQSGHPAVFWLLGAVFVAGGIAAIAWPDATVWVLAVLAGLVLTVTGVVTLIGAVAGGAADRGFRLLIGAVSLLIGVVVLAWPDATLVVLALLIGLKTVVSGGIFIAMGWNIRRLA